jgi:hypothetical protein
MSFLKKTLLSAALAAIWISMSEFVRNQLLFAS